MTNHPSDDFDLGPGNPVKPIPSIHTRSICGELRAERDRQDKKWGQQDHDFPHYYQILNEELGEASKAFLEQDRTNMRVELVQCAAVLVAMLECGDRNGWFTPFPIRDLGPKPLPAMVEIMKPDRRVTPCDKGAADRRGIVTVDLGPGTVSIGTVGSTFTNPEKVDSFPVSFKERRVSPVTDRRTKTYKEAGYVGPFRRIAIADSGNVKHDRRKVNAPRVERRFKVRRGVENYMSNLVGRRGSCPDRRRGYSRAQDRRKGK